MVLEKLHLLNFRNFQDELILFPENKIVRIFGSNGSGKTNLLEAIYILYTTRSFRNKKTLKDCVREGGEQFFHLAADIQGTRHGITFSKEKFEKSLFINQERVKSLDFIQKKNILHFSPDESYLFFLSQEFRRSLMDRYICAFDFKYLDQLIQYNHLRTRKVQILFSKTLRKKPLLMLETPPFLEISRAISSSRMLFLEKMNPIFQKFLQIFNNKLGNAQLVYRKRNIPEDFVDKEILAERVLYGCHKDELEILERKKDFRQFFSNGEKKAINLAFHFAFMEFIKEKLAVSCLVCLDDIESELDKKTLENILGIIETSTSQFIITSKLTDQATKSDILLEDGKIIQP